MRNQLCGVLWALLFGSCTPYTEISEQPCPPIGTLLTYENFGAGFMNTYCQSCHGSQSTDRAGAPGDFIFDTVAQVRQHRARIYVRAAGRNTTMPPGPVDPPQSERDQLAEWLSCNSP